MIVARLAPPATAALWLLVSSTAYPSGFTIEQVLGAPFASDIVAAPAGREFAWVSDARGRSNVWLAAASGAAGFTARALTHYGVDDGLAIEDLAFVPHHDALLFVRGGDPVYPTKPAPNPAQITAGVVQTVYLVDFRGREPVKLGEGHAPVASPDGKRILYLHEGKVFSVAPRRGAKSEQLFNTRGKVDSLRFSPDGTQLVFPAENDGWLPFYSVPASGGEARLLTPGRFEIEYAAASADGSSIVYSANAEDIDRRHLWRLRTADGALEQLTRGTGIETQPVVLGDGVSIAFLRADARIPAHAALLEPGKAPVDLMAEGLPADFPAAALVVPESIEPPKRAGIASHAELFVPPSVTPAERHPAVVFMHGGPIRQMLAGWHYTDHYSHA